MNRLALAARRLLLALALAFAASPAVSVAQPPPALQAVLGVAARVPVEARTASFLGRHRFGSGVVIDGAGLVLTAGYLIMEADEVRLILDEQRAVVADIVAYDNATGFGLVRAREPLDIEPVPLAESVPEQRGAPFLVAALGGEQALQPGVLVERREFAGYWEYLLDDALFVAPAHRRFAGAALIDAEGRLAGIGSLLSRDVAADGSEVPGMMFIPSALLGTVLPDLLVNGRSDSPPRPWLGLYLAEQDGLVTVARVADDSPAEAVGMMPGDIIAGVAGKPVDDLPAFYRRLWAAGPAGVVITLDRLRGAQFEQVEVTSADRYDWLRLEPTPKLE